MKKILQERIQKLYIISICKVECSVMRKMTRNFHYEHTVYRENFALVLFSPFLPSNKRANLKLG